MQEAVEHAQATGHVNFQEYKWKKQETKQNIIVYFFVPVKTNFMQLSSRFHF